MLKWQSSLRDLFGDERFGFEVIDGAHVNKHFPMPEGQDWLMLKHRDSYIGLFQGMFDMGEYVEFENEGVRFAILLSSYNERARGHLSYSEPTRGHHKPCPHLQVYRAEMPNSNDDPNGNIHELFANLPGA